MPEKLAPATIYTVTVSRGVAVGRDGRAARGRRPLPVRDRGRRCGAGPRTTFRFAKDLFESATAERPTIALWAYGDVYDESGSPRARQRAAGDLPAARLGRPPSTRSGSCAPSPAGAEWHADDHVPTDGPDAASPVSTPGSRTSQRHALDAPARSPARAGWYLVQYPSKTQPAQAILQVTDIAGYLMVSETRTLVWANDLASGKAIAGADVGAEGRHRWAAPRPTARWWPTTPSALLPDLTEAVRGRLRAGRHDRFGRALRVPAGHRRSEPDGGRYGGGWCDCFVGESAVLAGLPHRPDRATGGPTRSTSGACCATATPAPCRTASRCGWSWPATSPGREPALAQVQAQPRPTGAFTGSLDLRDVPEGCYRVRARRGRRRHRVAVHRSGPDPEAGLSARGRDGSARLHRRRPDQGDRDRQLLRGDAGPGRPAAGRGDSSTSTRTTDATGTAIARGTARAGEDGEGEGPDYQTVSVMPARAEEGQIDGASREFIVFPSMWTVGAESEIRGGRVRISGARQRRRSRSARGRDRRRHADLGPRSARRAGQGPDRHGRRSPSSSPSERRPERRTTSSRSGSSRSTTTTSRSDRPARCGSRPTAAADSPGSVPASDKDHDYSIKVSLTDPDGHVARTTSYANQGSPVADRTLGATCRSPISARTRPSTASGSAMSSTSRCAGPASPPRPRRTATSSTSPSRACASSRCSRRPGS